LPFSTVVETYTADLFAFRSQGLASPPQ
jgi:hypothetical protein